MLQKEGGTLKGGGGGGGYLRNGGGGGGGGVPALEETMAPSFMFDRVLNTSLSLLEKH